MWKSCSSFDFKGHCGFSSFYCVISMLICAKLLTAVTHNTVDWLWKEIFRT